MMNPVKTDRVAEICATFDLEWKNEYGIFWDHGAGRGCYQIDVLSPQPPLVSLL
jgi:hypothetical protein